MKENNKMEMTTIQNEQQPNLKTNIINEVIALLVGNNLTILESKEILTMVLRKIESQPVLKTTNPSNEADEVISALIKAVDKITC